MLAGLCIPWVRMHEARKVGCRIFGIKYSGNAATNTAFKAKRLPAMLAMPTTGRAETTRAARILRISENIREYPQPSSIFSTSFTPRRRIHRPRKIKGRGNSPKKPSIQRPPFNEPRTKDGKRTSGIQAKRKGRHIHPVSIPRPPSSRWRHDLLQINTRSLPSEYPTRHPPLIQWYPRKPNQGVGGVGTWL